MSKKELFIKEQLKYSSDLEVLEFIWNFLHFQGISATDVIHHQFRNGYCWHFAHILKSTFQRGTVCWAAPFGHFVWRDESEVPYDIEGVYLGEAEEFIPEEYLGRHIQDFLRIPGEISNTSEEEIRKIIENYRKNIDSAHKIRC